MNIEYLDNYSKYVSYVNEISGNRIGGHDASHSVRVYLLSMLLAKILKLTNEEEYVLGFAALYHDSGRTTDRKNDYHGILGAKNILKCKYLNYSQKCLAAAMIEYHSIDDNTEKLMKIFSKYEVEYTDRNILLCSILKDSDALDRVRFKNKSYGLNTDYLRIEKSKTLVNYAKELVEKTIGGNYE